MVMRIPIAPEGLPIIKWVWFIFLLSFLTLNETVIGFLACYLYLFYRFFRDPLRSIKQEKHYLCRSRW